MCSSVEGPWRTKTSLFFIVGIKVSRAYFLTIYIYRYIYIYIDVCVLLNHLLYCFHVLFCFIISGMCVKFNIMQVFYGLLLLSHIIFLLLIYDYLHMWFV